LNGANLFVFCQPVPPRFIQCLAGRRLRPGTSIAEEPQTRYTPDQLLPKVLITAGFIALFVATWLFLLPNNLREAVSSVPRAVLFLVRDVASNAL
jgi:hypothetical protein